MQYKKQLCTNSFYRWRKKIRDEKNKVIRIHFLYLRRVIKKVKYFWNKNHIIQCLHDTSNAKDKMFAHNFKLQTDNSSKIISNVC
jgi:hypothetical protein